MSAPTEATKFCHRCGQGKPASSFYRASHRPDGLQTQCKVCQNAQKARWKEAQDSSPALKEMRLAKAREVFRRKRLDLQKESGITEKRCAHCQEVRPVSEFNLANKSPDGYRYDCRDCSREYRKLRARGALNGYLLRNYGMTAERFDELRRRQCYRCGSCFAHEDQLEGRLDVDHCHRDLYVRGLVCRGCNTGIGKLGDTAIGVLRALLYLLRAEGLSEESARAFDNAIRLHFGADGFYFFPSIGERSSLNGEVSSGGERPSTQASLSVSDPDVHWGSPRLLPRPPEAPGMKWCRRCEIQKPHSDYSRNRVAKDGLQVYCKDCQRVDARNRQNKASRVETYRRRRRRESGAE